MKFTSLIFLMTSGFVVTTTSGTQLHQAVNNYEVNKSTFYYASDNRSISKATVNTIGTFPRRRVVQFNVQRYNTFKKELNRFVKKYLLNLKDAKKDFNESMKYAIQRHVARHYNNQETTNDCEFTEIDLIV